MGSTPHMQRMQDIAHRFPLFAGSGKRGALCVLSLFVCPARPQVGTWLAGRCARRHWGCAESACQWTLKKHTHTHDTDEGASRRMERTARCVASSAVRAAIGHPLSSGSAAPTPGCRSIRTSFSRPSRTVSSLVAFHILPRCVRPRSYLSSSVLFQTFSSVVVVGSNRLGCILP